MKNFEDTFKYRLIYIFAIDDKIHRGLLKIGETTFASNLPIQKLPPSCPILNEAAEKRINQYTSTAAIPYRLEHTEIAVKKNFETFRDYDVHRVLKNSGIKQKIFKSGAREWFKISLKKAVAAIQAVKENRNNLSGINCENIFAPIIFRPEQKTAINLTVKTFKTEKKFLWNAKMRFGKTLCALEVVRQMNFSKTIIITHRPVVKEGWYEDFENIFHGNENFIYGSKTQGNDIETLLASGKNFVYFASMQDLRGSETVGGKFSKNEKIFLTDWDFVIVDEAHEGTQTALADSVIKNIVGEKTKFLALSGTPFNIIDSYEENVFTWDYIQEQIEKKIFAEKNPDRANPYEELPKINIFTYDIGKILQKNFFESIEDKFFNFREFFRTNSSGDFVHEADVKNFLYRLAKKSPDSNYPYSTHAYRNYFRHSLWIIPGVKEGAALTKLLKSHPVFCNFEIVNVAGGDNNALQKVQDAIKNSDYTITLSCGKLTAGVTVPEWTAVFMLAGSSSTSAATYMQTIFRVQSPCKIGGKVKQNCYVFDFAPDRTLKIIAESFAVSTRAGQTKDDDRKLFDNIKNFIPIIAVDGSEMKIYDSKKFFRQLKRAYADRIVKHGFADNKLYNEKLLHLDNLDMKKFDDLKIILGAKKTSRGGDIVLNNQGLDNEQNKISPDKSNRKLSPEEKNLREQKKRRQDALAVLRQISIRMPLLIYGADIPIDEDYTLEMFLQIDEFSWTEFMPKGVTKEIFKNFLLQYYDEDIFIQAGHEIRNRAKTADSLNPTDRVFEIAKLFDTFKNPDKETVLTSWRVVNLHMKKTFGGWNFLTENPPQPLDSEIFSNINAKILEINSKTGLYPLYAAYSIYRARLGKTPEENFSPDELKIFWNITLRENIFVLCKTPMAEKITRRTLVGFSDATANTLYLENILDAMKNSPEKFARHLKSLNTWQKGFGILKFDAVIGNPPYQKINDTGNFAPPVYQNFLRTAFKLSDKVSLIHPARCLFRAGATYKNFSQEILNDEHFKVVEYFQHSNELFPDTDIKGGVAITLRDAQKVFGKIEVFLPFPELNSILQKVVVNNKNFSPLSEIIYSQTNYRLSKKFHEDNPDAIKIISKGHQNDFSTALMNKFGNLFFDEKPEDGHEYFKVIGRQDSKRIYKYFRSDWVNLPETHEKFKVLVPTANGSGAIGEVLSTPLVGLPLVGNTETFITIGAFDNEAEARACIAYIKSKFCRVMLGVLKVTQHNTPEKWAKVPLQDFSAKSDIDWSKKISEIDAQLYRKYNLSEEEIIFIERKVRAME